MLKVQILGSGLIPRLGGLAPRMEPTNISLDLIKLMLNSKTLKLNYYNEVTNSFHPLTKKNYQKIWKDYSVSRTASGLTKAANPGPDNTPAFTQEGVSDTAVNNMKTNMSHNSQSQSNVNNAASNIDNVQNKPEKISDNSTDNMFKPVVKEDEDKSTSTDDSSNTFKPVVKEDEDKAKDSENSSETDSTFTPVVNDDNNKKSSKNNYKGSKKYN